ncbi:hypothetical protein [Paenibacillus lignilyticus]|uniref:LPXTG cell wall anchor domain-containing protein n=1 Tax=Paenibacillus lignilyticus TaxID=1172615 RepID=A0ABS5CNE6_9BACL|nr:hypothetical protein [Paenibacillus lignilyticus]MBP3967386.1 hypothetical protein [Paenibacillus lignilyticus]
MRLTFTKTIMLVMALFFSLAPTGAWAYSYGDANTEDVAETFKIVAASLSKSPADWNTALAAHKERREEIAAHFGNSVAATLDANFKSLKAKETIANYKAILIMNLDRRFENTLKDVSDYTNAKMLLAKARATFVTLSPYAEAKLSSAKMSSLSADFDVALESIGNPGLFGVGQKDADEKALKDAVNRIYSALKPLFPYTAYKEPTKPAAGAGTSTDKGTTAEPSTNSGNTDKGTTQKPDKPVTKPTEPAKQTEQPADKPVTAEPDAAAPDAAETADGDKPAAEEAAPTDAAPADDQAASADDQTAAAEEPADTADNQATDASESTDNAADDAAATDNTAVADEAAAAEPETIDGTKEHAAMARTDKTNTGVTVGVIGGVLIIGAGAVWLARRKGFF